MPIARKDSLTESHDVTTSEFKFLVITSDFRSTIRRIRNNGGKKMGDLKPGDVVRVSPLKGPWMIVESCEGKSAVCFWFDKNDAHHRETFSTSILEPKKSETSGISGFAGYLRKSGF